MRVGQVLLGDSTAASRWQQFDRDALSSLGEVVTFVDLSHQSSPERLSPARGGELLTSSGAEVVHLYGNAAPPLPLLRAIRSVPILSHDPAQMTPRRSLFFKPPPIQPFPEPVDEPVTRDYVAQTSETSTVPLRFGTLVRNARVRAAIDLALVRLHRFRDDIEWELFDAPPSVAELRGCGVWIDPAPDENDLDGMVAEALVGGLRVVATRTALNVRRLNNGAWGLLVPLKDPNELVHAALNMLFKDEVSAPRLAAAEAAAGRFDPVRRAERLMRIYREITQAGRAV